MVVLVQNQFIDTKFKSSLWVLSSIWGNISSKRRQQTFLLLGLTLLSSLAEVFSLTSVIPFISIITNQESFYSYPLVNNLIQFIGLEKGESLLIYVSVIFVFAAVMAGIFRVTLLWVSIKFGNAIALDFSLEIFRRTLYRPYKEHTLLNSSEVISSITQRISAVSGIISAVVSIITSGFIFLAIVVTLFTVNTLIASLATLIFGIAYFGITFTTKKRVLNNGHIASLNQGLMIKVIQEGLGGIRDIALDATHEVYCRRYEEAALKVMTAVNQNVFVATSPRYIMEALGLVLVATLVLANLLWSNNKITILPMLGMLALGAQRSLPLLQQIYGGFSVFLSNRAAAIEVMLQLSYPVNIKGDEHGESSASINFSKLIELKNVSFKYADYGEWAIKDISLVIPKGARVGIIGPTGGGKSTFLDLLMCLLEPEIGSIAVDGVKITPANVREWQKLLAHVPQSIYLSDANIAENIAFGVRPDLIDLDLVRFAARKAQIADFIESQPKSYDLIVGERGVRLSGGQRQRIGIARAIYKQAQVLIFDEATSALDGQTESAVMESIDKLSGEITVFMIAHRLTTLKKCSFIIEIESGMIRSMGTYQEIYGRCS